MDSSNTLVTSPLMSKQSPGMNVEEAKTSCFKVIYNQKESNKMGNNHESNIVNPLLRAAYLGPLEPSENPPVAEKEKREYACKYCNKKFSKRQAYSGHQNGHKLERAIERNRQMANFRFVPQDEGRPLFFHGMNSTPLNFNRAIINSPYFIPRGLYPLPENNQGYPQRQRHMLGNVTHLLAHPPGSLRQENQPAGLQFSLHTSGSANSFSWPVLNWTPRVESTSPQINGLQNQQFKEDEDEGLDLSLKL